MNNLLTPHSEDELTRKFEQFFRDSYTSLYHFALQMIGDGEVCRDIVSDAFENVWAAYRKQPDLVLRTRAYNIVKNKCVDHIRHESARSRYADFCMRAYDNQTGKDALQETEMKIEAMYRVMDTLTPNTRHVLEECYFKHKKYAEVAEKMGISVSAVSKYIVKALKVLRSEIHKDY